jgi:hypothetical protein
MVDWEYSGPRSGVGAHARMRLKRSGPADWMEMEVIEADPPRTTTEETVGAGGRRRTRGTYLLEDQPGGITRILFRFEWLEAPLSERLIVKGRRCGCRHSSAAVTPSNTTANAWTAATLHVLRGGSERSGIER